MYRSFVAVAAIAVAVGFTGTAGAADVPFPSPKVGQVVIAAQTVTTTGVVTSTFTRGQTIVFRANAVDGKTKKVLVGSDVTYFYVTIPGQPNVKLRYNLSAPGATPRFSWTGTWLVPDTQVFGNVAIRVLIKTKAKRRGQFVQPPVVAAQLQIRPTVDATFTTGTVTDTTGAATTADISIYVDAVNGSRPVGAPRRQLGCTQSNIFKRGEQFVIRSWGVDIATADALTSENVREAYFAAPGQPRVPLAWGPHGGVHFWAAPWVIPADFPLGDTVVTVVYVLESGKTARFEYPVTITP